MVRILSGEGAEQARGVVPSPPHLPRGLQAREEPGPPGTEVLGTDRHQVQAPAGQHRDTLREGRG